MKYRKKPLVIDAIQYTGENVNEIVIKLGMEEISCDLLSNDLLIDTLEGEMRCSVGDYVIKGIKGEFYPCKEDIFLQTYEPLEIK